MVAYGAGCTCVADECSRSEVAEQWVIAALLHCGVPAAVRIHREHDEGPDKIDERQG